MIHNSVCVSVCVCLSVQPEISGMERHIATLLTPFWTAPPGELHKLLLKPIWCAVQEKKRLEVFRQLLAESRACTVMLPVTLGRMNLATTTKPLEHFRRVCVEGHALHITGTIVAIAFTWMGYRYSTVREDDYLIKGQPVCEWVTTSTYKFQVCSLICYLLEGGIYLRPWGILSWVALPF